MEEPNDRCPASARWTRFLRYALAGLFCVTVVAYLVLPLLSETEAFRERATRALSSLTAFTVQFDELRVGYDLSVTLGSFSVAVPSHPPFFSTKRAEVRLQPAALMRGRLASVSLDAPEVFVDRLPASPGPAKGSTDIPVETIRIHDGFVHYRVGESDVTLGPLDLAVDSLQAGHEYSVQLQNVTTSFKGFDCGLKRATVTGTIERDEAQRLRIPLNVSMSGLECHDAEFLRVAQGLTLEGELEVQPEAPGPRLLRLDLSAPKGELLWNRVYIDLKRHPASLRGQVRIDSQDSRAVGIERMTLSARHIGKVAASGTYGVNGREHSLKIQIDIPGLSDLYTVAIGEPLKEEHPVLGRASVGGHLSGTLQHRSTRSGASAITGRVKWTDGRVRLAAASPEAGGSAEPPALDASGIEVDFPLVLDTEPSQGSPKGNGERDDRMESGRIRATALQLVAVGIRDLDVTLAVRRNQLSITTPVRIGLLGGTLEVSDFRADQLGETQRHARFSLALLGLDLGQLSQAMGWPSLRGTITGSIPEVTVGNGGIRSDGEIRVQAFGGEVEVRNLRLDQALSPVPSLELDLDFHDLSLSQLTDAFEVGHISGVVRGAFHRLAIVNRQPVNFEAWVETVPQRGVSQLVSVTAIHQLSILGGSGGDPITQRILGFFDEYRYAKMGFRCRLENDRFILRGIEELEGKQYLVVGSFMPPRVNVISHNQTISFSEMVRRIGRVFATRGSD